MRLVLGVRLILVFLGVSLVGPAMAASVQTPNFVIHAPSREVADKVAQFAEKYRREKALEWLGKEMPTWGQKCPIEVKITPGGRGTSGGGATTFAFDRGSILEQRMQVEGDLEQVLYSVLPHEITHTVLAFHFRDKVPRWADEGGSVLSENDFERSRHDDMVRRSLAGGKAFRLRYLFDLEHYPRDGQDVLTLYAQGYAITRYLVERSSKPAFLNFLATAKRHGWDQALRQHYRLQSIEELEQEWLDWMKRGMRPLSNVIASRPAPPEEETAAPATSPRATPTSNPSTSSPAGGVELGTPRGARATPPPPAPARPAVPGSGSRGWSPLGSPDQAERPPARLRTPRLDD